MNKAILILIPTILCGCYSMPTTQSHYYDGWYGEFMSNIKYTGKDEVYQFYIGYEKPSRGRIQGFDLPSNELPVFPDFVQMEIDGKSVVLSKLTPEFVSEHTFDGPYKTGFFKYGDAVEYRSYSVNIHFYAGNPVYLYCNGGNVIFRNIKTAEFGSFPMSVKKMKSIFGEPTRSKKDTVL